MSFTAAGEEIIAGTLAGLYEAGTKIMAESQILVPVETGTLKRSGTVEEPVIDGDSATVTLGYGYGEQINPNSGEPATGYAVFVHENLEARHSPPTQAKFLEQPAAAFAGELAPTIEAAIKARTGRI